jgi:hypothetical protein
MSLREGDLADTVLRKISIDEFEPKTGDAKKVMVLGFYVIEKTVGDDLYHYLNGSHMDIRDVEVSPNPDDNGYYMVFLELDRIPQVLSVVKDIIKDVEKVSGKMSWLVRTHLTNDYLKLNDPNLAHYVIVDPKEYVTREEFNKIQAQQAEKKLAVESAAEESGFKLTSKGVWTHQNGRIYYDNTYAKALGQGHYRVRIGSQDRLADDLPKKFKTLQGAINAFNAHLQSKNKSAPVLEFLKPTNLLHADIHNNKLNMRDARNSVSLQIVEYGDGKQLMQRYGISQSAIKADFDKTLFDKLKSMLGDMSALPIDNYIIIYNPADQTKVLITQSI